MRPLPRIMVAPNGARLTKQDHPGLPVTIPEIVTAVRESAAAGADGAHLHVRDAAQRHVLDAGLYREVLCELSQGLPGFYVQITTEANGRYTPNEQRALVRALRPKAVSIALREITDQMDETVTRDFFDECQAEDISVQHILYDLTDIAELKKLVDQGIVPGDALKALIVLGRYLDARQTSMPDDLVAPARALTTAFPGVDWAVCAFGAKETACLVAARDIGGKARIGFENNLLNSNLTCATTNAERVRDLVAHLGPEAA